MTITLVRMFVAALGGAFSIASFVPTIHLHVRVAVVKLLFLVTLVLVAAPAQVQVHGVDVAGGVMLMLYAVHQLESGHQSLVHRNRYHGCEPREPQVGESCEWVPDDTLFWFASAVGGALLMRRGVHGGRGPDRTCAGPRRHVAVWHSK